MAKDPAVLFYTSDFLTGATFLTMEERGLYITLLCMQHQQGGISEKDMLFMCGSNESRVFRKFYKEVDGLYYNRRMKEETEKRKIYAESRRNNRIGKTKDKKKETKTSKTYVSHMENENENENKDIIINKDEHVNKNIEVPENKKFSMMCMDDEMNFIAPLTQKLGNTIFQAELLPEYFDEFNDHLRLTAEPQKEYQDYRRHFINWITKRMQSEQNSRRDYDPNNVKINRYKHPNFPNEYPYTYKNMYYYDSGNTKLMDKNDDKY